MIPGKQYTPEILMGIAWRRKWLILLPALAIATIASVMTYRLPNLYQADALILVVPQRVPEAYVRPANATPVEDRLQAITQRLLSRTRLERIIRDLNLQPKGRKTTSIEDLYEEIVANIDVTAVMGDTFRVTFTAGDPDTAMLVTSRLASLLIEENLRERDSLTEGTNQFIDTQLQDARRQLIENEKKLEAYRRQHDGELPTQVEGNLAALQSTEMQLQALTDSINRDRDRRLVLERMKADASAAVMSASRAPQTGAADDPSVGDTAADQLRAAEEELRNLELRLTAEHPDIREMKRSIVELRKRADAEARLGSSAINPAEAMKSNRLNESKAELESLDTEIAAKLVDAENLRNAAADYQKKIQAAPGRESQLTDLTRDYETLRTTYDNLLTKKKDSEIVSNLQRRQIGEQFKILDPARRPTRPFSPDRRRLYLLGIAAALAIGFGLAALVEYLDRSMGSEEDVIAALNLPVLATIPLIPAAGIVRRRAVVAVLVSLAFAAIMGGAVLWNVGAARRLWELLK